MERNCDLCYRPATKKCGACGIPYCSVEHQELAWPQHHFRCGKEMNQTSIHQPLLCFEEYQLFQQLYQSIGVDLKPATVDTSYKVDRKDYEGYAQTESNETRNEKSVFTRARMIQCVSGAKNSYQLASLLPSLVPSVMTPFLSAAGLQANFEREPQLNSHNARTPSQLQLNHKAFADEYFRLTTLGSIATYQLPNKRVYWEESLTRLELIRDRIKVEESGLDATLLFKYDFVCSGMRELRKATGSYVSELSSEDIKGIDNLAE